MLRPRATVLSGSVLFTALLLAPLGCSSTSASGGGQRVTRPEEVPPPSGGIAPDKEAEVQLLMQQRQVSIHKCYQDALNARNDRSFAGSVKLIIALGTDGHATDVRATGGTLPQSEVQTCLVDTIKRFEFPVLTQGGDVQTEFQFKPAY